MGCVPKLWLGVPRFENVSALGGADWAKLKVESNRVDAKARVRQGRVCMSGLLEKR
jgi:hypothetical protein